ncbi:zinc finger domain-containing protein [Nanoarchaeota archaeon]
MEKEIICLSCKVKLANLTGSVKFKCPKCGEFEIIRCKHCRDIVAKYKCAACGFEGPN